jgi:hypothetical protein
VENLLLFPIATASGLSALVVDGQPLVVSNAISVGASPTAPSVETRLWVTGGSVTAGSLGFGNVTAPGQTGEAMILASDLVVGELWIGSAATLGDEGAIGGCEFIVDGPGASIGSSGPLVMYVGTAASTRSNATASLEVSADVTAATIGPVNSLSIGLATASANNATSEAKAALLVRGARITTWGQGTARALIGVATGTGAHADGVLELNECTWTGGVSCVVGLGVGAVGPTEATGTLVLRNSTGQMADLTLGGFEVDEPTSTGVTSDGHLVLIGSRLKVPGIVLAAAGPPEGGGQEQQTNATAEIHLEASLLEVGGALVLGSGAVTTVVLDGMERGVTYGAMDIGNGILGGELRVEVRPGAWGGGVFNLVQAPDASQVLFDFSRVRYVGIDPSAARYEKVTGLSGELTIRIVLEATPRITAVSAPPPTLVLTNLSPGVELRIERRLSGGPWMPHDTINPASTGAVWSDPQGTTADAADYRAVMPN